MSPKTQLTGAVPVPLLWGNFSEIFFLDLGKLFKKGKFFIAPKISFFVEVLCSSTQFLTITRN